MTDPVTALVATGKAKLPAILTALAPVPVRTAVTKFDEPVPVLVSPDVVKAVKKLELTKVSSLPALTITERRLLTQAELDTLSDERTSLQELEDYIKARKEAQRAMVFNHFDVQAEAVEGGVASDVDQADDGHYILAAEDHTSDGAHRWVRQVSKGSMVLTAEALQEQVGDEFTNDDYLACTTQVRVLDEEKALLHLRKKPGIAAAWGRALSVGKGKISLYRR